MTHLILFINLGTPSAPTPKAVKKYLSEFLSDPYVVKIPKVMWWPLLHGIILPLRSKTSAALYQKIWTKEGSPLLVGTKKLVEKVGSRIRGDDRVDFAMRYGSPNIAEVLKKYPEAKKILCIPLYPQYSNSATGSSIQAVKNAKPSANIRWIQDYHAHPLYIEALAKSIENHWQTHGQAQKLILSYHGLPQREIDQGDPYFTQCQKTSHLLQARLGLPDDKIQTVFQSRFGKARWIQPYCSDVLKNLPHEGITTVDILCPGFPIDCLETLEEIHLLNRKLFLQAGGKDFQYIACLNDSEAHLKLFQELICDNMDF